MILRIEPAYDLVKTRSNQDQNLYPNIFATPEVKLKMGYERVGFHVNIPFLAEGHL
jgi:hypothetical protein